MLRNDEKYKCILYFPNKKRSHTYPTYPDRYGYVVYYAIVIIIRCILWIRNWRTTSRWIDITKVEQSFTTTCHIYGLYSIMPHILITDVRCQARCQQHNISNKPVWCGQKVLARLRILVIILYIWDNVDILIFGDFCRNRVFPYPEDYRSGVSVGIWLIQPYLHENFIWSS